MITIINPLLLIFGKSHSRQYPKRALPVSIVVLFALFWGYFLFRGAVYRTTTFYPAFSQGSWIKYPSNSAAKTFFRKTFHVSDIPKNVWLKIAADNDYEIFLNGTLLGYDRNSGTNSSIFQSLHSQRGQRLSTDTYFPTANYPEVQWSGSKDWKLAEMYDLTKFVRPGRNTLAIMAQSEKAFARILVEAGINYFDGSTQLFSSDATWKASAVGEIIREGRRQAFVSATDVFQPREEQEDFWFHHDFDDLNWPQAQVLKRAKDNIRLSFDPLMFTSPLEERWASAAGEDIYMRKEVFLSSPVKSAWVRMATPQRYDLFVNGIWLGSGGSGNSINIFRITPFLHRGANVIALHLGPLSAHEAYQAPLMVLFDGNFRMADGSAQKISNIDWKTAGMAYPKWTEQGFDDHHWGPASVLDYPNKAFYSSSYKTLMRAPVKGVHYYCWMLPYLLASVAAFLMFWYSLGLLIQERCDDCGQSAFNISANCFIMPLILLALTILLNFRFTPSPWKVFFSTGALWLAILGTASLILGMQAVILLIKVRRPYPNDREVQNNLATCIEKAWRWQYFDITIVLMLMFGAIFLLFRDLGFQDYHSDEFASLEAALGILKSGVPEYPSGIWYSRGPLYHYILALFVKLFGANTFSARLPAVVFGVAMIPMTYYFVREILKSRLTGLICAGLLLCNPWFLFAARNVRYYQQLQFFTLVAVYFFIKGFVTAKSSKAQAMAFTAWTMAILSQEAAVFLLPAFFSAYLFIAQPFTWKERASHMLGLILVLGIGFIDVFIFTIRGLTPFTGVGETSRSIIGLHFTEPTGFLLSLFVGDGGLNLVFSFFFLLAIPVSLYRRDRLMIFLSSFVFITGLLHDFFVFQVALRYLYLIYPLFIIVAVATSIEAIRMIFNSLSGHTLTNSRLGQRIAVILVVSVFILSYEPARIVASFDSRINRSDFSALSYVKQHMQSGDILATAHPQGAIVTMGRVDYYLSPVVAFDELYRKDGKVIDRWGGGELIDNIDKLRDLFDRYNRVWLVMSDIRLAQFSLEFQRFLFRNARPVFQPFFSNVLLWDRSEGKYAPKRHTGKEANLY